MRSCSALCIQISCQQQQQVTTSAVTQQVAVVVVQIIILAYQGHIATRIKRSFIEENCSTHDSASAIFVIKYATVTLYIRIYSQEYGI